jgi:hypothetical protein
VYICENNQIDFRKDGGLAIVKSCGVFLNDDRRYTVSSQTFVDKKYIVE